MMDNVCWMLLGALIMLGLMVLSSLVWLAITNIKDYREVKRALKYKVDDEG